jgi:preprotein translocase subunit SecE
MSEGTRSLPVVKYLTEVRQELQRVSWPSREQTLQKTTLVIAVSVAVGLYIGLLDFIFTRVMSVVIR